MREDGNEGCFFFQQSQSMIPHSPQLAPKESKARGNKPINITSHLRLRLNEFIRSFLREVILGERIRHVVRQKGTEYPIRTAGWWGTQHKQRMQHMGSSFPVWLENASGSHKQV